MIATSKAVSIATAKILIIIADSEGPELPVEQIREVAREFKKELVAALETDKQIKELFGL